MATVLDTPDLSFSGESLDVSCEIEAMLTGNDLATTDWFDLGLMRPIDIASPFKAGRDAADPFAVVASVGLPGLTPESMSYRFGLRDNARQTFGLRGDSIFYNPGATFVQTAVASGAAGQVITLANPAGVYVDSAGARTVLAVTVGRKRLTPFTDYTISGGTATDFVSAVEVTIADAQTTGDPIQVMYFSNVAQEYPQTVHEDATVKPAAIKGKDIDVYIGGYDPADPTGSAANRWSSVQSANVDWRATLEKDEEFGNPSAVANDFDIPEVSGSISLKPRDPAELFAKIRQASGVTNPLRAIGTGSAVPLELDIVLKDPITGVVLKRLNVPDAKFTVPGYSARVQTKLTVDLNFNSDGGVLRVAKGTAVLPEYVASGL